MHGVICKRNRHQVIQLTIITAITQVFRIEGDIVLIHECFDITQQRYIEGGGGANAQGKAVNKKRVALREEAKLICQLAADIDPVLGRDFHEVDIVGRVGYELVHKPTTQT